MENNTALAASAGMVIVAALGSGALYVAATADNAPAAPEPQAEVVVEYLDSQGNLEPAEGAVADPADTEPLEEYQATDGYEEYEEGEYAEEEHEDYEEDEDDDY